jgi:hypothetical protein
MGPWLSLPRKLLCGTPTLKSSFSNFEVGESDCLSFSILGNRLGQFLTKAGGCFNF